jgi:hypothetical protein
MRCEEYYNLASLQQLQSKEANFGQSRGTHVHNLLYLFYKCKIKRYPFNKCVNAGLRYMRIAGKNMKAEDFMLLTRKYGEYCAYYRNENIQPLAVEKGFSKILYEDRYFLFIYEGRIDFIGKFLNDPAKYWVDHKSEARKEDLNPDSFQFLGYSWALGAWNGLINYIGMQESKGPADAFRRTIVTHRKDLIQEWKEQAIQIFFKIAALNAQKTFLKNRTQCKPYGCRPCMFHGVCAQTHPQKKRLLLEESFVKRLDPWRAWD